MAITEKQITTSNIPVMGETEVPSELAAAARGLENQAARRQEAAAAEATAPAARRDSERSTAARKRRSNLGGASLKLEVFGRIDGCHLYWENDDNNRLELLLNEGFDFVRPEEVGMARAVTRVVVDSELTDRISKHVGTTEDGKPMRAYLLKCPDDIWEDIQASIADLTEERDRDILESHHRADDRYQPKGYESKVKTGRR